jgi:hypothetical protein
MTGVRIRQCPRCELRFTSSSELEYHLAYDHHPRPSADSPRAAVAIALVRPGHLLRAEPDRTVASRRRSHLPGWILGSIVVALFFLVGSFASGSMTLITVALALALTGFYLSWARTRARLRR